MQFDFGGLDLDALESGTENKLLEAFDSAFERKGGFSPEAIACFYVWLKEGMFVVDGVVIDPDNNPWLMPLYTVKRADILANKYADGFVMFKPAQVGASVAVLLLILWLCLGERGLLIAFYFPGATKLKKFVAQRFDPLLRDKRVMAYLKPNATNNLDVKNIHNSLVSFINLESDKSLDSDPVQIGIYDEVRFANQSAVDQTKYRFSAQDIVAKFWMSTAGSPNDLMDTMYSESDQNRWYSQCEGCDCRTKVVERKVESKSGLEADSLDAPMGLPLADMEPTDFIRKTSDGHDWEFFCRHTGQVLDPLHGGYAATGASDSRYVGYHFGAFLRPRIAGTPSARLIMEEFLKNPNKEFWNGYMARATIASSGAMVTLENTEAAKKLGAEVGATWTTSPTETTYAGVDCRTEELHLVVGTRDRITHVEIFQGEAVFDRLEQRLLELNVHTTIIDYLPQSNLTLPLVRRNKNIFLGLPRPGEMVRWKKEQEDFDVDDDVKTTKMVLFDQVKAFVYAMGEFNAGRVAVPPAPLRPIGGVIDRRGKHQLDFDVAEDFLNHYRNVAVIHRPKQVRVPGSKMMVQLPGQFDEQIGQIDFDPHFAHAGVYQRLAVHLRGTGNDVWSMKKQVVQDASQQKSLTKAKITEARVCGNCTYFVPERGYCEARRMGGIAASRPFCTIPGLPEFRSS